MKFEHKLDAQTQQFIILILDKLQQIIRNTIFYKEQN